MKQRLLIHFHCMDYRTLPMCLSGLIHYCYIVLFLMLHYVIKLMTELFVRVQVDDDDQYYDGPDDSDHESDDSNGNLFTCYVCFIILFIPFQL